MTNLKQWLRVHTFETHLAAFFLMAIPPIPLYFAAQQDATGWILALLSLVILGNILVLFTR